MSYGIQFTSPLNICYNLELYVPVIEYNKGFVEIWNKIEFKIDTW
jgi:hypothetical protein